MQLKFFALAALATTGIACENATQFKVPAETVVDVPGRDIVGGNPLAADEVFPPGALSEALASALQQSIDTSGYDKDAIGSLKLTAMSLTVKDPEENGRALRGLGFLRKLTLAASAEGVDDVVVAESAAGAFDGTPGPASYDMPLTDAELVPVFRAGDRLDIGADVELGERPNFATEVTFTTELTVDIDVGGVLNGSN